MKHSVTVKTMKPYIPGKDIWIYSYISQILKVLDVFFVMKNIRIGNSTFFVGKCNDILCVEKNDKYNVRRQVIQGCISPTAN